ncbi:transketolase [Buchnera aphidicola str. APS (Acyrthosiphon pisum)]|uniref:Transketolase n=1 Tax=Buchnera aphidicola subsp. Acyrthosiphon pisum (strain APS) TaxID=107806 RepID=TKT_BUCAI|nr:transketolase [Buchnera aphidicola]P57195.1 RecName: Full=Transketolase; Short=TK [Buchnera aphidicola str. APS (Acyrthosiphon pisum)]pir/E84940/ transketolase (EC 2.2.1.1) [imported] - Buchnera sp. (strain APS) [Buchnera sp. (in: enterobacteria)]ADP66489.1 transketolase [Buchnera aphidicola str. TLW03 (Acyrthosiphon pisum)]ADP67642.1 transketolase [Buchnera aphidicola str. JF98 (Acyrthosiphon pisum)]ACL29915.1 transketolase [Buchnera aphidicola str. Tuc7 (Acyrthosiphon pisum)]ADP65917.1 t
MYSRKELANAIRMLSIDAVQNAQSGHPGMPMGMADIAEVLWRSFLKHNPANPNWNDRDRFILSNGHGSMLLYSLLHLTGYNLPIEELKKFRQLNSKTPGHPETGETPGVETTTGPLGQGLANAVGMAIAERTLSSYFNRPGYDIINHYTWVFVGDGCLMEGISHEVCSLAGTLNLGKLIVFYDKNGISIDGKTAHWFTDDTAKRFESYNWHVLDNIDGHDSESIERSIKQAKLITNQPSIIICNTIIGFGSPNKSGTAESHGAPLGEVEISLIREQLKWNYPPFQIPKEIYKKWNFIEEGSKLEKKWNEKFSLYQSKYPDLSTEYLRRINKKLPVEWDRVTNNYISFLQKNRQSIASRKASQNTLEKYAMILPELIGGSADLSPSNLTMWSRCNSIKDNLSGNYIHYGVREFGMTAIANGISHHGGFIPYTATFLMFVEYARNAVRMAALMCTKHIFVYTHDSIGLGEDGPTHQPVEQLSSLRITPNIDVWRPSDQVETAVAWKKAIEKTSGPTALILSRQNLDQFERSSEQLENISYGAYILYDSKKRLDIIFISTGSELNVTLIAAKKLASLGYSVRVVSMPCTSVFDRQDASYKEFVLPTYVAKRVAVEASIEDFWYKYVGINGVIIGMKTFGESAPAEDLFKKFGFTVQNIFNKSLILLKS